MMHRWRFQRLFRWLVPALVLIVSLCALVIEQKASGDGLAFPQDSAYASLAVARTLADEGTYGYQAGEPIAAVRDSLWRLLLAFVGGLSGNFVAISYVLGALAGLATLLLCLRLARLLFPFPPFMLYTSILLIVAPSVLVDALSGTSTALATALVTAACLLHIEGLSERRSPLPISSAVLVGLLMWIRLEFMLLWGVFWIHAVVLSFFRNRNESPVLFVVTKGLAGLMVLALCFVPVMAWNFQVVRVPWPQTLGAPFTMDAWGAAAPVKVLKRYLSLSLETVPRAFGALYGAGFLSGLLERGMAWFGALFIAGLALWRAEERPYTIVLFLLVFLPIFYAFVYPYMGWQSAPLLFGTLGPLCVMAASFGIFRVPFLVENLYRKWKQGLPAASGFSAWWIAAGSILLVVCLVRSGSAMHRRGGLLIEQAAARGAVAKAVESGAVEGRSAVTDVPGWLAYSLGLRVIDLNGEATPDVLTCLDSKGRLDRWELEKLLQNRRPDSLVLWESRNEYLLSVVPCEPVELDLGGGEDAWPRVCALNWSVGP